MRFVRDFGIAVAGGLVVALIQTLVPGASLGRFLGVALVGTVLGVVGISFVENRKTKATLPLNPTSVKKPARVFVPASVTLKDLVGQREGLTTLQADKLTAFYAGKWMKVTGTVYDVKERHKGTMVSIRSVGDGPFVILSFGEAWTERVSMIGKGHPIKAVGEIEIVTEGGLAMKNCELVNGSVEPS